MNIISSAEPIVRIERVSKKFATSLKRAMVYGMTDIARAALIPHRFRSPDFASRTSPLASGDPAPEFAAPALRPSEFWAVRDVSFEIRRGECLGIIGHNGAGKSTIFKMLSGIYGPTSGRIDLRGSLSALIEVGSGFHPMLSGRENIYITGAIRGMKNEEIDRKYDQIVEFSGVGDFIDMPVKFYSSGMHVRLGFAVLAHLTPDILLIDEILAVGDLAFQRKCIEHINRLRESDMALALVSHSLYRIESLCSQVIWMDHGQVVMTGNARDVVKGYREHEIKKNLEEAEKEKASARVIDPAAPVLLKTDSITIHAVEFCHEDGRVDETYHYGEPMNIRIVYTARQRLAKPRLCLTITFNNVTITEMSMLIDGNSPDFIEGPGMIECRVRAPRLLPKVYQMTLWATTGEGAVYLIEPTVVGHIAVDAKGLENLPATGPYAIGMLMAGGVVSAEYDWDFSRARKADALADLCLGDE